MKTNGVTKSFIDEDFILESDFAKLLYHKVAKDLPIIDYHCHLPADQIADNRIFEDLTALWLEGDHYKWRAMRANGVEEQFCTGDADPYDKFLAYAKTIPYCLRNPLYHWSHLELKRLFHIDSLINEKTAPEIWARANDYLSDPSYRAQGIMKHFNVRVVCTTNDPTDTLVYHETIRSSDFDIRVLPTFRPDKVFDIKEGSDFKRWIEALEKASRVKILSFDDFLLALKKRHDDFALIGCGFSDHGLEVAYGGRADKSAASAVFDRVLAGELVSDKEFHVYASYLMVYFAQLDTEKDWIKQLHLGAYRNVNKAKVKQLGADTGFDSISDLSQAHELGAYFNQLEELDALPKTIIYNLNPSQNYVFATLAGNFQDGSIPSKIQFGSGWWFLDQKEGIEWQINTLSNLGLLSRFVGMLTDSRSFLSYPRHEYFRRILCNILGNDVEKGLIPRDFDLVARIVSDVSYYNAKNYFKF